MGKTWFQENVWGEQIARWDGVPRHGALEPLSGIRVVHLMPTFKQCVDIHGELALNNFDPEREGKWSFLGADINKTRWKFTFPGGSWLQWFGTKEADASRGIRCDAVTVDEADDVEPGVLDAIVKPWFSEPWSLRMLLVAGTPRRGRYGLLYRQHRLGIEPDAKKHYSFHATCYDAPEQVSREYIEEVKQDTDPEVFRREWLCDFDAAEGLVYPMFSETFHVRPAPEHTRWTEVIGGLDHGYEDPGALTIFGIAGSGRDATSHMLEEVYQNHQTTSWWAERIIEACRKWEQRGYRLRIYADPSRPDTIKELRNMTGASIVAAEKHGSLRSVEDGIACLADRLVVRQRTDGTEYAKLYIDPSCKNTIREFGLYRRKRDPKNKDRVLDEIDTANDHGLDSARYCLFSRFGKPASRTDRSNYTYG